MANRHRSRLIERATIVVAILLVVAGLALRQTPSASATALTPLGTTTFTMYSDGDSIGAGLPREFDPTNSIVAGTASVAGIELAFDGGTSATWFNVSIAPPAGAALKVGTFTGAQRTAFREAGHPGIDISGDGRGCNTSGSFEVRDLATSGSSITRLDLLYEQHCEGGPAALFGEIRIGEPRSAGLIVSTKNIVWPATPVGTDGLTVPVHIRNPSDTPVGVGPVALAGFDPDDFALADDSCSGTTLAAGESCSTAVHFRPTAAAPRTATLVLPLGGSAWAIQLDGQSLPGATSFSMVSEPGDYIGLGRTYHYTDGIVVVGTPTVVRASIYSGGDWWDVELVPGRGSVIAPGVFANATSDPYYDGSNGLSVKGNGRGCSPITGSFTVTQAVFSPADHSLQHFAATFEQHCPGSVPALTGELRFNASPMVDPFTPVTDLHAVTGSGTADLTWTNPGAASYLETIVRLQRGDPIEPQPVAGDAVYAGTGTAATISGIAPHTRYTVSVFTVDQYGNSSPPAQISIQATGPNAPPATFTPLSPMRVLDTRTTNVPAGWPAAQPLAAGSTLTLSLTDAGVPATATAAVLNVTATRGTAPTYITAFPAGSSLPNASNLNLGAGETRPNLVTVALGTGTAVSFANANGSIDLVADLAGYYSPTSPGGYAPLAPARVLDTRTTTVPDQWSPGTPVGAGQTIDVPVRGVGSVPADATSVVVNITAADPTAPSFVTAFPSGESLPNASNLNLAPGHIVSNAAIVKIGSTGGISLRNLAGSAHLIVDVTGAFGPTGPHAFVATSPTRLLDTRTTNVPTLWAPGTRIGPGQALGLPVAGVGAVPVDAAAAVINITGTNATAPTFLTAFPTGPDRPSTSSLNLETGETRANLAGISMGPDGGVGLFNDKGEVDVVIDLAGYYVPAA